MRRPSRRTAVALVLPAVFAAAVILARPAPARAAGTVRVEVYIGGAAACGAGFFLWFAQSWETGFAAARRDGAVVNLRAGRLAPASPLRALRWFQEPGPEGLGRDRWELELLRWEF